MSLLLVGFLLRVMTFYAYHLEPFRRIAEIMTWIRNCNNGSIYDIITHTYTNFKGGVVKLLVKLWHGWAVTSHKNHECNYLCTTLSQLMSINKIYPWYNPGLRELGVGQSLHILSHRLVSIFYVGGRNWHYLSISLLQYLPVDWYFQIWFLVS